MPRMAESIISAQNAQTAGWSARFTQAAPAAILAAILGAVLVAIFGFLGWITVSLGDLRSDFAALDARVTAVDARLTRLETSVEDGFDQTNERLTRLETRVIDIYKLLAERLPPPPEKEQP